MKETKKLRLELKNLNCKLDKITHNTRYMIYNANPWKFALYNFISGIFFSLGSLFGTAVIAAAIIYIANQLNFFDSVTELLNQLFNQVKWQPINTP